MGAQGTTTLNFGSFPGKFETLVDVTGQSGLTASSLIEAWVFPVATSDHSVDEHIVEPLQVIAYFKTNGEFTIRGNAYSPHATQGLRTTNKEPSSRQAEPLRLHGQFTVAWVWN